jgi:hypothetical protein
VRLLLIHLQHVGTLGDVLEAHQHHAVDVTKAAARTRGTTACTPVNSLLAVPQHIETIEAPGELRRPATLPPPRGAGSAAQRPDFHGR